MKKPARLLLLAAGAYYLYSRGKGENTGTTLPPPASGAGVTPPVLNTVTTPAGLTAPSNLYIGQTGYKYGSDYFGMLNQLPGESAFWFYGASNGQPYPTVNWWEGNGYIETFFPSHCVNQNPAKAGVLGFVEYKVFDPAGKLICYCMDKKGGLDPTQQPNKRGNNHPDFTHRWLPVANGYRAEFKNISTDPAAVLKIEWENNNKGYLNPGQSLSFNFNITRWAEQDPNRLPKLNCNIKP